MDNPIYSLLHIPHSNEVLHCSEPLVANIYYREFKLNLLTGEKEKTSLEQIHNWLDSYIVSDNFEQPEIFHFYYEFGFSCVDLQEKIPNHKPLLIHIQYAQAVTHNINEHHDEAEEFELEITEYPSFDEYHKKFEKVYQHLVDGNCYQVNLTCPFYFKFKGLDKPLSFIQNIWSRTLSVGEYAHATYIDSLGKLLLSNSPECLFQLKTEGDSLYAYTMPIKGTKKVSDDSMRAKMWNELVESKKDQGELYMITDLLRNDLTKICLNPAVVVEKKLPLHVPGLVHQFSKLKVRLNELVTLRDIMKALFPGGSVTGAPKKRVMEIIEDIENYDRGLYCGSTVVLHKTLKAASINIRSAVFDFAQNEIFYGAGGGITLLSQPREEFDECYAKMESFLRFLKVKNVNKS